MKNGADSDPSLWLWLASFIAITLVVSVGAFSHFRSETERIRQEKYREIEAISKLKADQIAQWRQERLGDIRRSSKAPFFVQAVREWLIDPSNEIIQTGIKDRLLLEQREKGYSDVLLLDTEHRILLSAKSQPHALSPAAKQGVEEALAKLTAVLSDLYRCPDGIVHVDAVAPIIGTKDQPIALLILSSNAESFLYPLIQSWPTPSRTQETLLVRSDGENVLFLNDLRHRPHTGLTLRVPVTQMDSPAVQAVLGKQGMFHGKDYREAQVLADLRPVPESPWLMVAKVDADEILAEARYHGVVVVIFAALFTLIAAGVIAYGYRRREARLYRDLYRAEREHRQSQEKYRTILYSIGDAVITTDTGALVQQMNPVAERLTGWPEAEAVGKPLDDVFQIVNEVSRDLLENPVQRVLQEGAVVGLANHTLLVDRNGAERPIADSGAPIRDENGTISGVVLVFRDQTLDRMAQQALQESEERYRTLFERARDSIMIIGLEGYEQGKIVAANAVAAEMHGYERDELLNLKISDLDTLESGKRVPERIERVLKGESVREEVTRRRKDASIFPVEISASVVELGKRKYALAIDRDITERKQAEATLRISEERFRNAFRTSPDSININRLSDGVYVDINDGFTKVTGFTRDDVIGKSSLELDIWADPKDRERLVAGLSRSGLVNNMQANFRLKDGRIRTGLMSASVTIIDGVPHILSITRDIDDLRRAEEERARLATAIEHAAETVVITDTDGTIVYVNPAFERTYGYSREEAVGANLRILKSGKHDDKFYEHMWKTITSGAVWSGRIIDKKKNGAFIEEEASISPIKDDSGKVVNYVAVNRDVTREVLLQAQLLQAQKMEAIGTLAGGVAHDFNNLLQVVLGYSELILSEQGLDAGRRDDLQKIFNAARDGAELVQRLLTFSRKTDINPTPINLNRQLEQVRKILSRTLPKMIQIDLFLADDLATVNADPVQVGQILMNLAVNARDAMPDGGKLIIETRNITLDEDFSRVHFGVMPGRYVLLTVTDTGHGMDKETVEHVFEPFYTTKRAGEGTGLGLAMVYGIVKQHQGHIMCYSEPGKGTTFKIYFPSVASRIEAKKKMSRPSLRGGKETVLLVDDEDLIRDLGSRILTRAGYTVLTASNGREALEVFRNEGNRISLVLLDLIMPVMGGKQCLEELLKIDPNIKVIVASGYSATSTYSVTSVLGAKAAVGKPFDTKQILQVVRETLDSE